MQEGRAQTDFRLDLPSLVSAAHELKAPLALVRQLALEMESKDCSDSERQILAQRIVLTSERALRLTTDLTRARRLEDAMFELEPVNSINICEEAINELLPLCRARSKEISLTTKTRRSLVIANRDLLRRIILNFADNALHYSEDDSPVAITVKNREKNHVRIGVRDYGPALPSRTWLKIKNGLREPLPMHNRPASSGLGIYIAGEFAAAMGAKIGATRHRDGVTFFVDLPASTQMRLL